MRHIISVLLENEAGALSRVVGLFSARGYNIETLTVAPTEDATLSRMTIVTSGSDDIIEQITERSIHVLRDWLSIPFLKIFRWTCEYHADDKIHHWDRY
ncbi:MAG: acetolactate synthase small subunit, partial [Burkholderiales bacterium]|nr:acetolactate synthase small subunit [Burkholderiales bacterium]